MRKPPFLGQVSLARPWERGPNLGDSRKRLGQVNCCVVKGPGGNQVKRCYNEGCGLNWISPEGIYPGVPECGVDGRPKSCSPQQQPQLPKQPAGGPKTPPPPQYPLNPTPTALCQTWNPEGQPMPYEGKCYQLYVCANDPTVKRRQEVPCSQPQQTTNQPAPGVQYGSMPTTPMTAPQMPTGAYPGDPFAAVAPQTPIQAAAPLPTTGVQPQTMKYPCPTGAFETHAAQQAQEQAQAEAVAKQFAAKMATCPSGATPVAEWAYRCAMAHRR